MYPLPSSSSEDEPSTLEGTRASQDHTERTLVWTVRIAGVCYVAGILWYVLSDPGMQLQLLTTTTRLLHRLARVVGNLAIQSEQSYYDLVDTLR
jgi:hypothetical protein